MKWYTLDEILNKIPETFKEKLEDVWYDITRYYPSRIRDGWWAIKRFFRNLVKYWRILWRDNNFDHGYMEELIISKLTWMADYFRTARIAVGEEDIYNKINLAVRIGKIAFDINPKELSPENYGGIYGLDYIGYVNIKNYKRFWPTINPSFFVSDSRIRIQCIENLRKLKARHIFYNLLNQYSEHWWD